MIERSYYTQPMVTTLQARVRERVPDGLVLDDTILYPGGGGQPADRGTLNGRSVTAAKSAQGVVHRVADHEDFAPGDEVTLTLDWEHRFDYMQQHSGQHLLSAALWQVLGAATVSVHQGSDVTTIEVNRAQLSEEELSAVERYAVEAIAANHPIEAFWIDAADLAQYRLRRATTRSGSIRLVRIGAIDLVACAGVHLLHTSLIQSVAAIGTERIRGHTRAAFKIGLRAARDYAVVQQAARKVGTLLSVPPQELPTRVAQLQNELAANGHRISQLASDLALRIAAGLDGGVHDIGEVEDAVFRALIKHLAAAQAEAAPIGVLATVGGTGRWAIIGAVEPERVKTEFLSLREVKGGGRAGMWQGVLQSATSEVRARMAGLVGR